MKPDHVPAEPVAWAVAASAWWDSFAAAQESEESAMAAERRRAPRVEILGRLQGQSVSLAIAVRVREISLGGMSIETPVALPVNAVHDFKLTLGDGAAVHLRAVVRHCRNLAPEGAPAVYVSGLQFVDDEASEDAVGDLIDGMN